MTAPSGKSTWEEFIFTLGTTGTIFFGITSGPSALMVAIGAVGMVFWQSKKAERLQRQTYALGNQTPDLIKLKAQLKKTDHVLLARYFRRGKLQEAFVGNRSDQLLKKTRLAEVKTFTEILDLADKVDSDPLVFFYGRPM